MESYRDEHSLKLAGDYRPHSHNWRVMSRREKVRPSRPRWNSQEPRFVILFNVYQKRKQMAVTEEEAREEFPAIEGEYR